MNVYGALSFQKSGNFACHVEQEKKRHFVTAGFPSRSARSGISCHIDMS